MWKVKIEIACRLVELLGTTQSKKLTKQVKRGMKRSDSYNDSILELAQLIPVNGTVKH